MCAQCTQLLPTMTALKPQNLKTEGDADDDDDDDDGADAVELTYLPLV